MSSFCFLEELKEISKTSKSKENRKFFWTIINEASDFHEMLLHAVATSAYVYFYISCIFLCHE